MTSRSRVRVWLAVIRFEGMARHGLLSESSRTESVWDVPWRYRRYWYFSACTYRGKCRSPRSSELVTSCVKSFSRHCSSSSQLSAELLLVHLFETNMEVPHLRDRIGRVVIFHGVSPLFCNFAPVEEPFIRSGGHASPGDCRKALDRSCSTPKWQLFDFDPSDAP